MESASERAIREGKKRDVESDKRAIRAWFATGLNVLPSSFENFNFIRYVRHKTLFSTKPCLEVLRIATLHFTLVSTQLHSRAIFLAMEWLEFDAIRLLSSPFSPPDVKLFSSQPQFN